MNMSKTIIEEIPIDENWIIMKKELKEFKNTLVLDFLDTVIFRDIIDWEEDFYYEYEKLDWTVYQSSAVIWFTPLKNRLTEKEYLQIKNWWDMNTKGEMINKNYSIIEKIDWNTLNLYIKWTINDINNWHVFKSLLKIVKFSEQSIINFSINESKLSNKSIEEIKLIIEHLNYDETITKINIV